MNLVIPSTGIKTGKTNLDTSHGNLVKIVNNAIADSTNCNSLGGVLYWLV